MLLLAVIGLTAIAHLFAGVYLNHRQTCRRRLRARRTAVAVTLRRLQFAENVKAIGGSGGRS
ncbi:MAG TPA: hypothetical protein VMS60_15780 [Solirubrobacterales bacterium]|nr:hypothetical protein [Solirubrobacterales bacterium]